MRTEVRRAAVLVLLMGVFVTLGHEMVPGSMTLAPSLMNIGPCVQKTCRHTQTAKWYHKLTYILPCASTSARAVVTYGGGDSPPFFTSAGEWSALRPCRFIPGKEPPLPIGWDGEDGMDKYRSEPRVVAPVAPLCTD
jgi:hypothetical protein